jgi:glycosyltransferase involved in cell wall biosynthesis
LKLADSPLHDRLRVLALAQYFSPDMGGASTRATNVVNGLLKNGCRVTVVAAFPHYPHGRVPERYKRKAIVTEHFGSAKVYRVWIPALPHSSLINRILLHSCFVLSSLFALPFVGDVDTVWSANPNLFSFFPSFAYGVVKHAPIVRNVDDLWPEVFYELGYVKSKIVRKALDFMAWLSYAVPAAITPISEGYKHVIVSKYGVPSEKVHVIEVGVENVRRLRDKPVESRFTVMYSGILGLGYDFDIILKGAYFLQANSDIVFIIRGVGEKAAKLKKEIHNLGLKNVILNTLYLPKNELEDLLDAATVFVLPMAGFGEQGLPAKLFEYQAYGKPIVCISEGEPARYIAKSRSGLVVKPHDVHGFVEAIRRLYKDRFSATELGLNGRVYASRHLISKKIGKRMYTVMNSVCFKEIG